MVLPSCVQPATVSDEHTYQSVTNPCQSTMPIHAKQSKTMAMDTVGGDSVRACVWLQWMLGGQAGRQTCAMTGAL